MTAVWLRVFVFMALGWLFLGAVAIWAKDPAERKVVFIAGRKSHGPGVHEYEKDVKLLKYCIDHLPSPKGIKTEAYFNDWPADPSVLDDADTIVMISDGSDQNEQSHPLLQGDHLAVFEKQMKRGCGFVAIHYTTFVPSKKAGDKFLEWIGGYFDYQQGNASNHWYSKILSATATVTPASPEHPICRGLKPYPLSEEFYYNMRFRENDPRLAPILTVRLPGEPRTQTIAWAVERKDGGRGFAFTGGHDHGNWRLDGYRKMILNGILWTARGNVPAEGAVSAMPPDAIRKPANRIPNESGIGSD